MEFVLSGLVIFVIAIGAAAAVVDRHHADNRIMFTSGKAALRLNLLGDDVKIAHGIPLSAKGKNVYFDKQWKRVYEAKGWTVRCESSRLYLFFSVVDRKIL